MSKAYEVIERRLILCGSEQRAPVLIEGAALLSDREARKLVAHWWSGTEAWSGDPELREGMMALLRRLRPVVSRSETPGRKVPHLKGGGLLTIYRGNLGEQPDGGSWTLEREIAENFASMAMSLRGMFLGMYRADGLPSIWRARVLRSEVLGFFDDRDEAECVVDDGTVLAVQLIAQAVPPTEEQRERLKSTAAALTQAREIAHDPLIGPCARCGKPFAEHPGGFCPDQVGPDGMVEVGAAAEYVPADEEAE